MSAEVVDSHSTERMDRSMTDVEEGTQASSSMRECSASMDEQKAEIRHKNGHGG